MAELIGCAEEDLTLAAKRLREGTLVAFPTETVYGLGANALDEAAALRVFAVKGRPPTDPLICHVPSVEDALPLYDFASDERMRDLVCLLGESLWPGPVTFVAPASSKLAPSICGGSGCVGVRIPDHPVAMRFLQLAGVPVAAPSANTFGHVSPTTAAHVASDLAKRDDTLTIVDGGATTVGIESSVVKICNSKHIELLRRGRVSVNDIRRVLQADETHRDVVIVIRDTRSKDKAKHESAPMDGPGQLLTHYSPSVASFLVTMEGMPSTADNSSSSSRSFTVSVDSPLHTGPLMDEGAKAHEQLRRLHSCSKTVVLDFGGILKGLKGSCLAYRSLSDAGDVEEACRGVFDALRWTETVGGEPEVVVFPMVTDFMSAGELRGEDKEHWQDLMEAVEDRLFRAASGNCAHLRFDGDV